MILIDRGDYQVGVVIRKGSRRLGNAGIESFRERLVDALPWLEAVAS